jgi:hypothetical protein
VKSILVEADPPFTPASTAPDSIIFKLQYDSLPEQSQSPMFQIGNQPYQQQHVTPNVMVQQSPVMKNKLSLTDNTSMKQSHHFGTASQHQQQGRAHLASVSYTPDQKPLWQAPPTQHQLLRQDQQLIGNHNTNINRIVATNTSRDRPHDKAQTSVPNQGPVTIQTPFSKFAKKVSAHSDHSISIPNQQQQYPKINSMGPSPQVSFSFQSHTHPTRVMTAETKKFIQK